MGDPKDNTYQAKGKLRVEDYCVIGPDGKVIRELSNAEQALISEYENRQPGYTAEHLEEIFYEWEGSYAAALGPENQRNPYQGTENAKYWDTGFKRYLEYRRLHDNDLHYVHLVSDRNRSVKRSG